MEGQTVELRQSYWASSETRIESWCTLRVITTAQYGYSTDWRSARDTFINQPTRAALKFQNENQRDTMVQMLLLLVASCRGALLPQLTGTRRNALFSVLSLGYYPPPEVAITASSALVLEY